MPAANFPRYSCRETVLEGSKVDEDEVLPDVELHGHEAVVRLVEVEELEVLLDERARTVEAVTPAVVLARELPAAAVGLWSG